MIAITEQTIARQRLRNTITHPIPILFAKAHPMTNWEPCRFIDYGDGFYGLMFDDFGPTDQYFEERDLMGGGYSWEGVVEALVRLQHPDLVEKLEYDPEGSMFVARSADQTALETVAELIRKAQSDMETLQLGIDNADPERME